MRYHLIQIKDGKLHHNRCPRLLAALEGEQLCSTGIHNNNNNNNGDLVNTSPIGGGSGIISSSPIGLAPRASPEVSELELSINHRNTSLSSENNINVNAEVCSV